MGLYDDLYKYKRVKLYDTKKARKDSRKYLGYDYKNNLMQNSLSNHLLRNDVMRDFIAFCTDYYYNTIKQIRVMKNWKNYTTKKDDKNIR
jgi:hypothetical protein